MSCMYSNQQKGFILLEQIVYIVILIAISAFTTLFALQIRARTAAMSTHAHAITQLFSAQDRLLWDLYCAPPQINKWLQCSPHEICFTCNDRMSISWRVRKNRLLRSEQHQKNGKKVVTDTSVAATNIESITFDIVQHEDLIAAITFRINSKNVPKVSQKVIYAGGVT